MKNSSRRSFLKTSLLVAAGTAIGSSPAAFAGSISRVPGIIYSSKDPGKWTSKVEGHEPKIDIKGKTITITTNHVMTEGHYIVRHTLVSENGKVLGEKTFYPTDKEAVSAFTLPSSHSSRLYATSFCNLHDLWLTEFTL